ncbi:glycosyltransferase [Lysobacter korlensis]|uniref:Glycosyltransferase n=1 Tax=Lysobacter korlensis TaxID=553636 RepID=A0ABV6RZT1_9GAMM
MTGVLVHEWIAQSGGSENVLQVMADIYPDADILCLWNDSTGRFDPRRVRESWLARTPLRKSKALALPFMPATWARRPGRDYDWALVSSHLFAHHVRFDKRDVRRYVYVHSPARYIWTPELDRRGSGPIARSVAAALKPLDRRRARETREFATNSEFVRRRVADAWGVEARVIHPPVEVTRIQQTEDWAAESSPDETQVLDSLPPEFVLGASRFIPYKRLEEAIRAGEVSGLPVVIAGNGPELDFLRARAERSSVPVQFVLSPSTPMLYALYRRCSVFVFPAVEDFGIMPVEAMAAGAPVVANAIGGAAESVVPGVTGALTDFASDRDVEQAVRDAMATQRNDRLERARTFSRERFVREVEGWVGA